MTQNGKEITIRKGQPPAVMISLAVEKGMDLDKISKMMELQERWETNQARKEYSLAMVRVQKKMPMVTKKERNAQTNSKYAAYDEIIKVCQPIYTEEGFSVTFYQGCGTPEDPLPEGYIRVSADIMHDSGHTRNVHVDIPVETTGPKGGAVMTKVHATGSAFSYGKSYLIRLIFNIPTGDDDDGNRAGGTLTYISEKQLSTITDMINAKSVESSKFLSYLGVDSIEKIPMTDFNKAMTALRAAKGTEKSIWR
jgi:hypothetical protein